MTLKRLGTLCLILFSDSRLVVNYFAVTFVENDGKMRKYLERLKNECSQLDDVKIEIISHNNNSRTNSLETFPLMHDTKHKRIVTIMVLFGASPLEA